MRLRGDDGEIFINIITKTAADIAGTQAGARAGSFNTREAWALHGGRWGEVEVAAYLGAGRTDGPGGSVAADAQSRNDRAFGTRASLAPAEVERGYDAVDAHIDLAWRKLRLRAGYKERSDVRSGTGVGDSLDPVGRSRSKRTTADLTWQDRNFARDLDLRLQASWFQLVEESTYVINPPGASFTAVGGSSFPNGIVGSPARHEKHLRLGVSALYTGFAHHRLRLGAGRDHIDMYRSPTRHLRARNGTLRTAGPPTCRCTGSASVSVLRPIRGPR